MAELFTRSLPKLTKLVDEHKELFKEIKVKSRTVLLREGEVARKEFQFKSCAC